MEDLKVGADFSDSRVIAESGMSEKYRRTLKKWLGAWKFFFS